MWQEMDKANLKNKKGRTSLFIMAALSTAIGLFWLNDYLQFGYIRLKEGTPVHGWQAIICSVLLWSFSFGSWYLWWRKRDSK